MIAQNQNLLELVKKGLAPIFLRDIFSALVRFVVTIIAARNLTSSDFSSYILICLIAAYADAMFRFKTDQSVGFFIGQKKLDEELVFKLQNTFILISTLVMIVILFFLKGVIFKYIGNENLNKNLILLYLITYCILTHIYSVHVYLHLYRQDFDKYKKMTIISSGIFLVIVLSLSLLKINIYLLLLAQNFGLLCANLYTLRDSNFLYSFRLSTRAIELRQMLSHSGRLYLLDLIGMLQTNYLLTISGAILNPSQVGHIGIIRQFLQLVEKVPGFFNQILFGTLMKRSSENRSLSIKVAFLNFVIAIIILVLISLILTPINMIIFDSKFPNLFDYFKYIAPGTALLCATAPLILFLTSKDHIMVSVFNYIIALVFSVIFGLVNIESFTVEILGSMFFVMAFTLILLTLKKVIDIQ